MLMFDDKLFIMHCSLADVSYMANLTLYLFYGYIFTSNNNEGWHLIEDASAIET